MTADLALMARAVAHAAALAWSVAWPAIGVVAAVWWLYSLRGDQ